MAPEVIQGQKHTRSLDLWAVGVIAYQFLVGAMPFNGSDPLEVFDSILKRQMVWPPVGREEDQMSPEAYEFIDKLLNPDPEARLGSNGWEEIKNHPFFKGVDWSRIHEETPPYVPNDEVKGTYVSLYFPKEEDNNEEIKAIEKDMNSRNQMNSQFDNFEGVCYSTLQKFN